MDAVDIGASADIILVLGGADDDTTHYLYGIKNDSSTVIQAPEITLLATVTTDIATGIQGLSADNFIF